MDSTENKRNDTADETTPIPAPAKKQAPRKPKSGARKKTPAAKEGAAGGAPARVEASEQLQEERKLRTSDRKDRFEALAGQYAKAYPGCAAFHITTDGQVFLERDLYLAKLHQRGIGGGEVRTIKVR